MWTLNKCLLTRSGVGIWYPIQEIEPSDTAIFRDNILSKSPVSDPDPESLCIYGN